MVRSMATLIEAMDQARKIKKDIEVHDGTSSRGGDKIKWDGLSESSKNKKDHQDKKDDRSSFCMRCHSSHKGSVTASSLSCRCCGKLVHKQ